MECKVINASINPLCWLVSCPLLHCGFCPYRTTLYLTQDGAVKEDVALCGSRKAERSYSDLGTIEIGHFFCLVCVDSNLGTLMPGFGCSNSEAESIINELKQRVLANGNAKHNQLSDNIKERLSIIDEKMDIVLEYLTSSDAPSSCVLQDRGG